MHTEWRTVSEAPEYEVSSSGQIRSIYTRRPLVGGMSKGGYRRLVLCTGGVRIYRRVARLVCAAFHGPCPPGHVVRHLDGTRTNDAADNLRWSTQKENIGDKVAHGTAQVGVKHPRAILNPDAVRDIRTWAEHWSVYAARYGIKKPTVYAVKSGRLWAHVE
jgi:hypothetical protein